MYFLSDEGISSRNTRGSFTVYSFRLLAFHENAAEKGYTAQRFV